MYNDLKKYSKKELICIIDMSTDDIVDLQKKNQQLKEKIKTLKNINSIEIIYLVIPTINGEINGDAIITLSLDYDFGEVAIYEINLKTLKVKKND